MICRRLHHEQFCVLGGEGGLSVYRLLYSCGLWSTCMVGIWGGSFLVPPSIEAEPGPGVRWRGVGRAREQGCFEPLHFLNANSK
jgi:hypothetical protein